MTTNHFLAEILLMVELILGVILIKYSSDIESDFDFKKISP